jgi:hypothetical protein
MDHMDHCSGAKKATAALRAERGRKWAEKVIIAAHYGTVLAP